MIDLSKLDEPEILPEDNQNLDSARNDEPPRVLGPVDHYGFPIRYSYRRAFSRQELEEHLGQPFISQDLCHLFLSRGDVDLISFAQILATQNILAYLGVATFSANLLDIRKIRILVDRRHIGKCDIFLGSVFRETSNEDRNINLVKEVLLGANNITVSVVKSHAKVIFGCGPGVHFVVLSSANLNTNYNAEATAVIFNKDAFDFCRDFFENLPHIR